MASDEELLKYYNRGWVDACHDRDATASIEDHHLRIAYQEGVCSFIAGDDVKAIDAWTNEQVLRNIKNAITSP